MREDIRRDKLTDPHKSGYGRTSLAARTKEIKPTQKAVKVYYESMKDLAEQGVEHEQAVRQPFATLLTETAKTRKWTFVAEQSIKLAGKTIRPDGAFHDEMHRQRGYWEAKDIADDLGKEIKKKIKQGYPTNNIIFQTPQRGLLYQDGNLHYEADLTDPRQLATLLNEFYGYAEAIILTFDKAIEEFSDQVAELGKGLMTHIDAAHKDNEKFKRVYGEFFDLCKESLNPNLSRDAVNEMLAQHLLTERVIRTLFDRQDFVSRNVIADKVEKVIAAMTSKSFSRHEYLKSLDRFYVAIEETGKTIEDFSEKQHFLNKVYERFFQGFSVKVADTHGIVYTPQEIVDFMCASVEHVLKEEFDQTLGSDDVVVLDPCTGTGNFIVNLINRVDKAHLKEFYTNRLFANEVMLMPYYIASLNIEHAYMDRMKEYEPFDGLCFVDTLDMAEHAQGQLGFMTQENTERVEREKDSPITVIIGNPPYNVGQVNENDNNKNRKYKVVERAVKNSYAKDSKATNKNALSDAYVKFFRWATDRLNGRDGVVCFVSNNSFVENIAFDGMRKHLLKDFTRVYHVDLHGNVRKNPKLSGTTHNVFGIQVGVGITVAVRKARHKVGKLKYHRVPELWRKEEKSSFLTQSHDLQKVSWKRLKPSKDYTWLVPENSEEFATFVPVGSREDKAGRLADARSIFALYSNGVKTNRDTIVYDFDRDKLVPRVQQFIEDYNAEVDRYNRIRSKPDFDMKKFRVDGFVKYDRLKWSMGLKNALKRGVCADFDDAKLRVALYRPFSRRALFFDRTLNEALYQLPSTLPTSDQEHENKIIIVSDIAYRSTTFSCLVSDVIPDLHLCGTLDAHQCFPFYTYDKDGSNRRENITDWALKEFRAHYNNKKITKWDIFYYIYGVLHHPAYREKYGDCLKRELPRIPYAPDFKAFAKAGEQLAKLHLEYEDIEPYDLKKDFDAELPPSYIVEKMRLAKDKKTLVVNDSLTLSGIPAECFEYRLGNRSALDWVIDQYRVKIDKRSGIRSDPNRKDDPEYIIRLVGQVVQVSLDTVAIVNGLPSDFGG